MVDVYFPFSVLCLFMLDEMYYYYYYYNNNNNNNNDDDNKSLTPIFFPLR